MFSQYKRRNTRNLIVEKLADRKLFAADLGVIDDGLRSELFDLIQNEVNQQVYSSEAPLLGSQLAARESSSQFFTTLTSSLASVELQSGASTEKTRHALETALAGKIAESGIPVTQTDDGSEIRVSIPIEMTTEQLMVMLAASPPTKRTALKSIFAQKRPLVDHWGRTGKSSPPRRVFWEHCQLISTLTSMISQTHCR